jgi:HPt (histidine-containing phosphotransfer) domain-containing protein
MAPNDPNSAAAGSAEQPVFDLQRSLERLGNDRSLLADMVQFFLEDCPGLLTDIAESIQAGNAEKLQRAAHSLKGLASTFDATGTVNAAKSLEMAGAQKDLRAAPAGLQKLRIEADRLQLALSEYQQTSAP